MAHPLKSMMMGFDDAYPAELVTRFPHIADRIAMLWSRPDELASYFQELVFTERTDRQGFPPAVANELFRLSNAYSDMVSARAQNGDDPWGAQH